MPPHDSPTPQPLLAVALREARDDLRTVEALVDDRLEALFVGWRSRFPTEAGWRFTAPATIDVYDVQPAEAAVIQLWHAGFDTVVLHDHDHDQFLHTRCTCRRRSPP